MSMWYFLPLHWRNGALHRWLSASTAAVPQTSWAVPSVQERTVNEIAGTPQDVPGLAL